MTVRLREGLGRFLDFARNDRGRGGNDRGRAGNGAGVDDGHGLVIDLDKLNRHLGHFPHISADHVHIRSQQYQRLAVRTLLYFIYFGNR